MGSETYSVLCDRHQKGTGALRALLVEHLSPSPTENVRLILDVCYQSEGVITKRRTARYSEGAIGGGYSSEIISDLVRGTVGFVPTCYLVFIPTASGTHGANKRAHTLDRRRNDGHEG